MSFKMRGRSIGSIKKSVQEKTRENGEKYYTLQVQDREYVDGKNNTITIFVNIWGKLSDKMKEILSHEGTVIALEGNVNKKISLTLQATQRSTHKVTELVSLCMIIL